MGLLRLLVISLFLFGCNTGEEGPEQCEGADCPCVGNDCQASCEAESCEAGFQCLTGNVCCPESQVNGEQCCEEGSIAFAGRCVAPQGDCLDGADCSSGSYCEPALGAAPAAGSDQCSSVTVGKCVALPEACSVNDGPGCIKDTCEVTREIGHLDTALEWKWPASGQADEFPDYLDIWNTPVVGRLADTNCDGVVNLLDPPSIVTMTGQQNFTQCAASRTCKSTILRVINGKTGEEVWSKRSPEDPVGADGNDTNGEGLLPDGTVCTTEADCRLDADEAGTWTGVSPAIGDVDHNGTMEILAVDDQSHVVLVDHEGTTLATSDLPIPSHTSTGGGWGGGLALADMNGDGNVEVAFGANVFEITKTNGTFSINLRFRGTTTKWGGANQNSALSYFANIDADPDLELIAGTVFYNYECGSENMTCAGMNTSVILDGYTALANLDNDPRPELVMVRKDATLGQSVSIYNIDDNGVLALAAGPMAGVTPGGNKFGGPPTIANFSNKDLAGNPTGDKLPEIGVAFYGHYEVFRPALDGSGDVVGIDRLWATPSHDLSSSVTGSTVFDFEGDGVAEVVYNDECYLWVYDGEDGSWRYATQTTSFTGTEASLVVDVDSDGSAEIVMIGNDANPSTWGCNNIKAGTDWRLDEVDPKGTYVRPGWVDPDGNLTGTYRGLWVWRSANNSWVGTRSLWNQHSYSVSNVCGDEGESCPAGSTYGDIPSRRLDNWEVPYLNNARQNIQGEGVLDAPDPTVGVSFRCGSTLEAVVGLKNVGRNPLPVGAEVALYGRDAAGTVTQIGTIKSNESVVYPGGAVELVYELPPEALDESYVVYAELVGDETTYRFVECDASNNRSSEVSVVCGVVID